MYFLDATQHTSRKIAHVPSSPRQGRGGYTQNSNTPNSPLKQQQQHQHHHHHHPTSNTFATNSSWYHSNSFDGGGSKLGSGDEGGSSSDGNGDGSDGPGSHAINRTHSNKQHGRSSSTARTTSNTYANPNSPIYAAPHPRRTVSSTSTNSSSAAANNNRTQTNNNSKKTSNVQVKHGAKPGQIYMPEGVVDMDAFGQILALDESDPTREFSKALVWAWCDQAEMAVEEMELFLQTGDIVPLADKAHYLKGSSGSLGLIKVAQTCQSIYHVHFPPSLAHMRAFSYTGTTGGGSATARANSNDSANSGSNSGSSSSFLGIGSSSFSSATSSASTSVSPSPFQSYTSHASNSNSEEEITNASSSASSNDGSGTGSGGEGNDGVRPSGMKRRITPPPIPLGNLRRSSVDTPPLPTTHRRSATTPITLAGAIGEQHQAATHYFHGAAPGSTLNALNASSMAAHDDATHFEQQKLDRAKIKLETLKCEIRGASEWLYTYYLESDRFAGVPGSG